MREIKFRAWDKKTKQWICVGYAPLGEVTLFGVVEQWLMEHKEPNQTMLDRFGDVEESQFTGLKDKYGNDIYEGDVIEANWEDSRYPITTHAVEWDEKAAAYMLPGGTAKDDAENYFKVIGNIYQNPELIVNEK